MSIRDLFQIILLVAVLIGTLLFLDIGTYAYEKKRDLDYGFCMVSNVKDGYILYSYYNTCDSKNPIYNIVVKKDRFVGDSEFYFMLHLLIDVGKYNELDKSLIMAIAELESDYDYLCRTGRHYGLMQIQDPTHRQRAKRLGFVITDPDCWYDVKTNLTTAVDLFWDIYSVSDKNETRALMMYNAGNAGAKMFDSGYRSKYAEAVLEIRDRIQKELQDGEKIWEEIVQEVREKDQSLQK